MPKAYSYIRMSRPEQLRGDSLRRQLDKAHKFAAEKGLELDDSLRDLGISAYSGANRERGALAAFLRLVKAGKIENGSWLLVESLDRLSREEVLEALELFLGIIRSGITVATLADRMIYSKEEIKSDWTKLIISLTIMSRAHEESRTKSDRLTEAWQKKREAASERPLTSRVPEWLRVRDGKIEPIPERAEIIRRIFEEAAGGYGKRMIAMRLNAEGIAAFRSAKGWYPSYVGKILSNRAVIGEYQPHRRIGRKRSPDGPPIQNYYPIIVPESLFWRAQSARQARKAVPGRRGEGIANLLQGLAKCRTCGSAMLLENKGAPPKGGRYLACSNNKRGAGCENRRRWRYDVVERATIERVTELDLQSALASTDETDDTVLDALRAELTEAEERRRRYLDLLDLGDEAVKDRVRDVAKRIKSLKQRIKEAEEAERKDEADGPLANRLEAVRRLRDALATAEGHERHGLRARLAEELRRTLERIDFSEYSVIARYRPGRQPKKSMFRPYPASVILLDAHPESVAAKMAEAEAAEAQEAEDAKRAAESLARFRRRKTAKAK